MRIGIVGFGSIARRHLRNIRKLKPDAEIVVCHLHSPGGELPDGADQVVHGLEALSVNPPQVALITGPAITHLESCLAMLRCGADLFVEKPLADSIEGLRQLGDECRSAGRLMMVGYNLRFHRALQALKDSVDRGEIGRVLCVRAEVGQYLPDWRPGTDYRRTVTARRELGGGVLLELSHELDYLRWIFGDITVAWGMIDRVGDLEIDVEDVAEVMLRGTNREVMSVHLDMLQRSGGRGCQIHGTEGSLSWRSSTQSIEVYVAREQKWRQLLSLEGYDHNEMYVAELEHFFQCVETRREPLITFEDGIRVLEVIEAIKRCSATERWMVE